MSIWTDFHRVLAAAIWLLSTTIATPLLPEARSAAAPRPRLFVQDPPVPTFTSGSALVVLHVAVKDRRGMSVSGLTRASFTVLEDGRRQEIQFFGEQDTPVDAGLVVHCDHRVQEVHRVQIQSFLQRGAGIELLEIGFGCEGGEDPPHRCSGLVDVHSSSGFLSRRSIVARKRAPTRPSLAR